MSALVRPLAAAAVAGLIGLGAVLLLYTLRPALAFEMDRPLPSFVQGIHGAERDGALTFSWTSDRVEIDLDGLNRGGAWFCTMRYRGGARGPGLPAPTVDVTIDGVRVARGESTPDYQELAFRIPGADRSGARIGMIIAPTFVPGGADTRTLGCADRSPWLPARRPRAAAAARAGGGWRRGRIRRRRACDCGCLDLGRAAGGAGDGPGRRGHADDRGRGVRRVSTRHAPDGAVDQRGRRGLRSRRSIASGASGCHRPRAPSASSSGVALWLKLIALLHPAKPEVDALFNAHRLEWVLAGKYHFTQPFIGGVEMPYAIGLYLFTSLWTWITSDHTALIRGVTAATDVAAGALLYPIVLRAWGQRRTAVLAVLAYQLPPLAYGVLGDANLREHLRAVDGAGDDGRGGDAGRWRPGASASLLAFAAVLALALASHVSTAATLMATLGALAVLYFWRGDLARRRSSVAIVIAMIVAAALAWFAVLPALHQRICRRVRPDVRRDSGHRGRAGTAEGYMGTADRVRDLLRQAGVQRGLAAADSGVCRRHRSCARGRP